jgi:hypothetical protein
MRVGVICVTVVDDSLFARRGEVRIKYPPDYLNPWELGTNVSRKWDRRPGTILRAKCTDDSGRTVATGF